MAQQFETLPNGQRRVVPGTEPVAKKPEPMMLPPQPALGGLREGLRQQTQGQPEVESPAEDMSESGEEGMNPLHPAIGMGLQNYAQRNTSLPINVRMMLEGISQAMGRR